VQAVGRARLAHEQLTMQMAVAVNPPAPVDRTARRNKTTAAFAKEAAFRITRVRI